MCVHRRCAIPDTSVEETRVRALRVERINTAMASDVFSSPITAAAKAAARSLVAAFVRPPAGQRRVFISEV